MFTSSIASLLTSTKSYRFIAAISSALLLSVALTSCSSSAEEAAPMGYRYWGYSQSSADGKMWMTAMEGPATTNPKDGSVEGWSYTISAEGVVDPAAPSSEPDFDALCSNTEASADSKRIGYVIEFGPDAIHPEGDVAPENSTGCVSVPQNATGLEVLNAAAQVRAGEGGFICGLNGFPSKDCGADPIPVPEQLRKKK